MKNIIIKHAHSANLAAIQAIDIAAYGTDNASHWLAESLADPAGCYFIAFLDDTIIGYCGMYHVTSIVPNYCKIATIATRPNYQGQGLGRLMLQKMLQTATKLGLNRTKLEVGTKNHHAINLYKSLDFKITEHLPNYYNNGDGAYIMWRTNNLCE